jgi:NADH:ubiquinone oxidoreductase subunit F (NADH-binding)
MTTQVNDTVNEATGGAARPTASGLPRLLPAVPGVPEDLRAHLARYGRPPYRGGPSHTIQAVEQSGLTGRGGAAFPVYRKMAIVAGARGRKVIVGNGAESEPASYKDALLLRVAPNLVLDGLQLAAEAVGASEAYLYLHPGVGAEVTRALAQRQAAGLDWLACRIAEAPPRFLAGQESALVNRLGGGPAVPTFVPPRVTERGLGGAPTLVQNVETLAHLALIARYGPRWFRALGTAQEPGSMLTTVHTKDYARVVEAEIGAPLRTLVNTEGAQAVLIGGFHGTWLPVDTMDTLTLDNATLKTHGAAVGAGIIAALPAGRCGLAEAARVARYLAAESAGQCGPCLNGLPRMAAALAELAGPGHRRQVRADLERWAGLVTGRGACNHPDGTARFVRSTLTVFAPEISLHARGQCSALNHGALNHGAINHGATNRTPFLPLPDGMPTTEDDWT